MTTLTKVIGKAIWLLESITNYTWKLNKDKKYIVIGVVEPGHTLPDGSINDDWCEHLIIQNEDGTISDVKECCCIICPDSTNKDEVCVINKYLDDNGLWGEVYQRHSLPNIICVDISWGDWRHSHLWCKTLMGYIGYTEMGVEVTEENGSDCYSAIHYYYKVEE